MKASRGSKVLSSLFLAVLIGADAPESPVADAAMRGDVDVVRQLLREGADVNGAQGDGMSALHWAAERGSAELTEMLLYAGATVDAVTRIGKYTPLHIASRNGQAQVVSAVLSAGADVGARTDPGGTTALHLAATAGDASVIGLLVEAGAEVDAREVEWQQTPLIFAAARNRIDAIRALLESGADPNLAAESFDLTAQRPIDRAASRRSADVLAAFTDDGAWRPTSEQVQAAVRAARQVYVNGIDPDAEEEEDDNSRRRGPPNIVSKGGLTPLLHATRQGHLESIAALLDGGADVDRVGGGDGTSPLLIATINGQFDAAMLLLQRGADPNVASSLNGVSPLWATVNSEWQPRTRFPQPQERGQQQYSYLEMIEGLLVAGADANHRITMHPWYMVYTGCGNGNCGLIDTNGATAFLRAAYATDLDAMRLLHRWGADPFLTTKAPEPRRRRGRGQREQAISQIADADGFAELSDSTKASVLRSVWTELPDSVKEEVPEFAVTGTPDAVREDVLAHAQRQDSVKAAEPDPSGLPPVEVGGPGVWAIHAASGVGYGEGFAGNAHRHVDDGWLPSVKFLVEDVGMDVNARDHNGYTAIHHAAARGDNDMIRYLVEKGGDVTVVSRRGQSTADMANAPVSRLSPIPETIALLVSLGAVNNDNCVSCQ
ncbi:MAG TPA: ankyrin repeat domain-containing protein [Gemmatimonadetes bacterium]|nr:ankyrin repeat domain-containing protein [Gemmatimonadota bacterium]